MSLAEAPKCETSIVAGSPGSVFMRVNTAAATPSRTKRVAASRQARKRATGSYAGRRLGSRRAGAIARLAGASATRARGYFFSHISAKYAS